MKLGRGRAFCRVLGDDHVKQTPFRKDTYTLNFNVGELHIYSKCLVGYILHSECEESKLENYQALNICSYN